MRAADTLFFFFFSCWTGSLFICRYQGYDASLCTTQELFFTTLVEEQQHTTYHFLGVKLSQEKEKKKKSKKHLNFLLGGDLCAKKSIALHSASIPWFHEHKTMAHIFSNTNIHQYCLYIHNVAYVNICPSANNCCEIH